MTRALNNLAIGESLPPPLALFQMASDYWASQAIYVAARLGIADLLKDGPMSYLELAEATATHPASLRRLLRALASLGVLATEQNYRFGLLLLEPLSRARFNAVDDPYLRRGTLLRLGRAVAWHSQRRARLQLRVWHRSVHVLRSRSRARTTFTRWQKTERCYLWRCFCP